MAAACPRPRHAGFGQSTVELGLALPLLMVLLISGINTSAMISDYITADNAVRQGARLAAQIGGAQTSPTVTQTQADGDIVQNVLAAANTMPYATLNEVDVYGPGTAVGDPTNGQITGGDYQDNYDGTGTKLGSSPQSFTMAKRQQSVPNESSIGVRLIWTFKFPFGPGWTITFSQWAVMKATPVQT